jgi:hypothetical protein
MTYEIVFKGYILSLFQLPINNQVCKYTITSRNHPVHCPAMHPISRNDVWEENPRILISNAIDSNQNDT